MCNNELGIGVALDKGTARSPSSVNSGETCLLMLPNVYRQDRLDYILGWVTAWQFETLCSDLIVAAAT